MKRDKKLTDIVILKPTPHRFERKSTLELASKKKNTHRPGTGKSWQRESVPSLPEKYHTAF